MTPVDRLEAMRRILVAMDASQGSLSALETATALAELVHGELEGLFIEDADLFALADLPFSREVRLTGGGIRALDPAALRQEVELQAMAARRAMQRLATQRRVRWSFRSVRGSVTGALTTAAREVDILCIGRRRPSPLRPSRLANSIRAALESASVVLVAGDTGLAISGPVAFVADDATVTGSAIRLALEIAGRTGQSLLVYVTGRDSDDAARQQRRIETLLSAGSPVRFRTIVTGQPQSLFEILRLERHGLVVCTATGAEGRCEWVERLVDAVGCPVLVFRSEDSATETSSGP